MKCGIFIQQIFPLGAFGPRQWSLQEMRRLFRWLKKLGYDRAAFTPWPVHLTEDSENTILEYGALYHSGIATRPPFDPGDAYCPSDRYLGSPEGLAKSERFRDQIRIAREEGLSPWLAVLTTLGAPQFVEEHPELAAIDGSELFNEGAGLCPSKPEALGHLLDYHARQIEYFDAFEGFILWPRDPGGCSCERCTPQPEMMARVGRNYYEMIRSIRPNAPMSFMSWHINQPEVPALAGALPEDLLIFEAPRIHAMDVPWEHYVGRLKAWQERGRQVEGWIEIQENPTSLLPSVYPLRTGRMVDLMRGHGMENVWATSTQNPYLFPLHIQILPKLWKDNADIGELLHEFILNSYGEDAVVSGLRYFEAMELAWDRIQSMSQLEAGFIGLFVITFPNRLLPERCIRNGVPAAARQDVEEAAALAKEALRAAEDFADCISAYHALDANIIVASAEVFSHRVDMRLAKVDVLDTLHTGDADSAVREWSRVEKSCAEMVAAAKSAPNTDVLATHWRRLELLPDRLKTLAAHLPELAERKRFRPINQPMHVLEKYEDPK